MCNCRERVNKGLVERNAKIAAGIIMRTFPDGNNFVSLSPPMIVLERCSPTIRGRLPTLLATHCPFCGEEYPHGSDDV